MKIFTLFLDFENYKIQVLANNEQMVSLRAINPINNKLVHYLSVPKPGTYYLYLPDKEYNSISSSKILRITADSYFSDKPKYQLCNSSGEINQAFAETDWDDLGKKVSEFLPKEESDNLIKALINFKESEEFKKNRH